MKLKGVKFYEVVDIGRKNNSYYIDKEGQPNNVKIHYDSARQIIILTSPTSGEVKVVPITNVVYMQPHDGELAKIYGPVAGKAHTAGSSKAGHKGKTTSANAN